MNSRVNLSQFTESLAAALRGYQEVHGSLDDPADIAETISTSLLVTAGHVVVGAANEMFSEFALFTKEGKMHVYHQICEGGAEVADDPITLRAITEYLFDHDMTCESKETE